METEIHQWGLIISPTLPQTMTSSSVAICFHQGLVENSQILEKWRELEGRIGAILHLPTRETEQSCDAFWLQPQYSY